MTYITLPDDLPTRLRRAGLTVVEIDGWRLRGRPASTGEFKPVGSLNHHDGRHDEFGDDADDLAWAKWMFLTGRGPSLPPPLAQLALSVEGVIYVGAAGRANHAGVARPSGSVAGGDGNALYVGTEWMLSGFQPIPPKMYEAGVKLNGVLMDVLGNSVQTISCHYNTSVTGKWDIGDPDGVVFNGHSVLNVPKFRDDVKKWRASRVEPTPPPKKNFEVVGVMHASLQFSDNRDQQDQDLRDLFARARKRDVWWITGTEAGPGSPAGNLLLGLGQMYGYRLFVPSHHHNGVGGSAASWIAVAKKRIKRGSWSTGFRPAIPASRVLYERAGLNAHGRSKWGPRGVVHVGFENRAIGRVNVASSHYLTKGRSPKGQPVQGINRYEWNQRLASEIGDWARDAGKGKALAFYGGDQNMVDRHTDTFFCQPLTSAWDEVKKWQNTGHGNIDVIASYDHDARVEAIDIRALNDTKFFQHSDHFVVEAEYKVGRIK